jgi:hypothetical protein
MNQHYRHQLGQLPSTRDFLERVGETLRQGISVLVLTTPVQNVAVLEDDLLAALSTQEVIFDEVVPSAQTGCESPFEIICRTAFWGDAQQPAIRAIDDLLGSQVLPEVFFVRGLMAEATVQRAAWIDFARRWAEDAHSITGRTTMSQPSALLMCLTLSPGEAFPAETPRLRIFWWWSMTTALDVRLLIRLQHRAISLLATHASMWREYVLPPLVGADLGLLTPLWDLCLLDFDQVFAYLQQLAAQRGWTPDKLRAWRAHEYTRQHTNMVKPTLPLSKPERTLWSAGVLDYVDEIGPMISSVALAALGDEDGVRHRLWRGQAALALPDLDELRTRIAQELTRLNGTDWITTWLKADANRTRQLLANQFLVEWGELDAAVRRAPYHRQSWLPAIQHARTLRNQLAHYQPISFHEYELLLKYLRRDIG